MAKVKAATYAERLTAKTSERGRLCVGIDPMPSVLEAWGESLDVAGLERVARGIVETLGTTIAVFKPQSAFFEPYGSAGIAVLERVIDDIRQAGAISVLDVKRGDIGSSMSGYAEAYLGDGPLGVDAMTVSPYLGFGSLKPAIKLAEENKRGIYVLARTSNPDGTSLQMAKSFGVSVAQTIVDEAARANQKRDNLVGLVIGGTHGDIGCEVDDFNGSILVPGIGAQGGKIEDLRGSFGPAVAHVLPTASREVIGGGQAELEERAARLLEAVSAL